MVGTVPPGMGGRWENLSCGKSAYLTKNFTLEHAFVGGETCEVLVLSLTFHRHAILVRVMLPMWRKKKVNVVFWLAIYCEQIVACS